MDLPVQNGFEKADNGRVGGHHAREQEASPMQKDHSVLWSDIAKPVFPVVGRDTTRVLVHNHVCVCLGWTHYEQNPINLRRNETQYFPVSQ
jgi:hypothetical protein